MHKIASEEAFYVTLFWFERTTKDKLIIRNGISDIFSKMKVSFLHKGKQLNVIYSQC